MFRAGIYDVPSSDTSTLAAVRAIVLAQGGVETPNVDTTVSPAPTQTRDPYPEYLKQSELEGAFVAGAVLNSNGSVNAQKRLTVKLTADGLDIDDLIIEDVA